MELARRLVFFACICVNLVFALSDMPLKGIPPSITPELLFALAKMGHGDTIVIADANFPAEAIAAHTTVKGTIRVANCTTASLLYDILALINLDSYAAMPGIVMDMVETDKEKGLEVPAYTLLRNAVQDSITFSVIERFDFYDMARGAFCVVQTTDPSPYANCIISKGVC